MDYNKKLLIALLPAEDAYSEHTYAKGGIKGADRVELAREDLEHQQGEAELRERSPHVRPFECPLQCAQLDNFGGRQHRQRRAAEIGVGTQTRQA